MIGNNPTNVDAAYDILLEQIEAEIDLVNRIGSRAFEAAEYGHAREALARVERLTTHRDKVAILRSEWHSLAPLHAELPQLVPSQLTPEPVIVRSAEPAHTGVKPPPLTVPRRNLGRARIGDKTPEADFFLPILKALVEFGGSASTADVLDRVEILMKHILNRADYEPRKSHPDEGPSWRNRAEFARNTMVHKEGLLKRGSPHGIWEVTEEGRRYLARHQP